ncbi:glutathione S-transferase, alpha tandem duplicate 1 isoform X2 [Heptranchias perlo]|uniref:glutathione S-transferase, alpha tandem duplicate 1 isoform X2 n=1 Tax=Heptranchias perlo TaxID=212740 RepID=UPI003559E1B4
MEEERWNLFAGFWQLPALRIDMYADGARDLMDLVIILPFKPSADKDSNLAMINKKAKNRYFPAFEKVLIKHGGFLVGNQLSIADLHVLEAILMVEELCPSILSEFPQLQSFKSKISKIPAVQKFLQPGSPRKPPPDDHYVQTAKEVLRY